MSTPLVNATVEDRILTLTIQRPEALNALNAAVLEALGVELEKLEKRTDLRGVIITGAGEKAFVAGADIKEISGLDVDQGKKFAHKGQAVFRKLELLPLPVIACVNGFAFGGGLELALSCDFIYASNKAKVGLPEVGLGLIPGFGGCVRLARVVGINRAREMILTGEPVTAEQALSYGLFNKVCEPAELLAEARKVLLALQAKGPKAIAAAKLTILSAFDQSIEGGLATEAQSFGLLFGSPEPLEGTKAFLEKRKPHFT